MSATSPMLDGVEQPVSNILELEGLKKAYGPVKAVRDASMTIPRGRCTAIVGDNGAGKSTLVKMISGVVRPDEGVMRLNGAHYEPNGPLGARGSRIETVYQDLALCDELSVVENIFLGREVGRGVPGLLRVPARRAMRTEVHGLIARTGVKLPSITAKVARLSGGQRQGLAIARALAWNAELVVLDEPTAALGVRETHSVEELITRVANQGVSVVIISHNLDQVFRIAHKIVVMRQGRSVAQLATAETTSEETVSLIVGGNAAAYQRPKPTNERRTT